MMRFKKKMRESGMRKIDKMVKDPSFIPTPKPALPRRRPALPWLMPTLISAASCALILAVALPIALTSLPYSNENSPGGEPSNSMVYSSAEASIYPASNIEETAELSIPANSQNGSSMLPEEGKPGEGAYKANIRLENPNDLLLNYEKNASFVDEARLSIVNADGKAMVVPSSMYEVDSSAFKSGVPGKYRILCSGKESDWNFDYNVIVEDYSIDSIEISSARKVYYVGEPLLSEDVSLEKTLSYGSKVRALQSEVALEGVDYDPYTPGKYKVSAYLKTNPSFKEEYEVEVKPLEEIAFDGTYAYTDLNFRVGEPTFVAFSITDFEVTPIYEEILLSGPCHKRLVDGNVILESDYYTQTITYIPKERSMVVSGIAGDPDMVCFEATERDAFVTAKGAGAIDDDRVFLAKGGYFSWQMLDYFAFMYGNCYRDEAKTIAVNWNTLFLGEDSVVYVGVKNSVSSDKGYLGSWYDDISKRILYVIDEKGARYPSSEISTPYTVEEREEEVIIRIKDGEILAYQRLSGTMRLVNFETGERYLLWKKYDPNLQALVTLYINNSSYVYVSPFGEPFKTVEIRENSISWFEIPTYFETPLFKDTSFSNVKRLSNYMSDFSGRRGDYNSYWEISGAWDVDRIGEGHSYYLRIYEDMEQKRLGWIEFTSFAKPGEYGGLVHFEDGEVEKVSFLTSFNGGTISILGEIRTVNYAIWADMPFLGSYFSEDGAQIDVLESGNILRYLDNGKGYSYRVSHGGRITYLSENRIDIVLTIQDNQDNRVEKTIILESKGAGYIFEFEGKSYVRD